MEHHGGLLDGFWAPRGGLGYVAVAPGKAATYILVDLWDPRGVPFAIWSDFVVQWSIMKAS